MSEGARSPSWFQRFLLPGFAFKAVIIGGGYATGRELAEFFVPAGPWGGLAAMAVATILWSAVCAATFAIAVQARAFDYRAFFQILLGRGWVAFELVYACFVILILAVYAAAAGAIGAEMAGLPALVGAAALAGGIIVIVSFGNRAVEGLFKYVSIGLYAVYALFLAMALSHFGGRIGARFDRPALDPHWFSPGVAYASYNVVGAVVILPMLRHLNGRRDAVIAGLLAGPLAMVPAAAFFIAMVAFYPEIAATPLPSAQILQALHQPAFHFAFQLMIFAALLESGTGAVHAVNERIAAIWRARSGATAGAELTPRLRAASAALILGVCVVLAARIGLVALIANGYRLLALAILAVYVVPLTVVVVIAAYRSRRYPESVS